MHPDDLDYTELFNNEDVERIHREMQNRAIDRALRRLEWAKRQVATGRFYSIEVAMRAARTRRML